MTLDALIAALQGIREDLPGGTTVYVPEKTRLNGAGWRSPQDIREGYDPHPISAPYPAPLVVYIS